MVSNKLLYSTYMISKWGERMVETKKINFIFEEYKTLREEIKNKIDYQYKILSLGVGGITVFFGAIFEFKIYELFLVLPALIFANAYLYNAETRSIIYAGNYVKKIENSVYRDNSNTESDEDKEYGDIGWENWLDTQKIRQYIHFGFAADVIFGSLFIMSVAGIWIYNQGHFPKNALWITTVAYILISLYWLYFIVKTIRIEEKVKRI
jgi:hypothetical protein